MFDGALFRVAIGHEVIAFGVFAAFAGIAFSADAVHGDGQGFMGFLADRAIAHGAGFEATYDGFYRFHFFKWNRARRVFELEQAAQRTLLGFSR